MNIIALDLGATTGVCYGAAGEQPTITSWDVRADMLSDRGLKLMRHLHKLVGAFKPDVLYIEAPPNLMGMVQRGTNIDTLQALYGLDMLATVIARSAGIRVEHVDVQKARRHFLGFKPKGGEGKRVVRHRCKVLGWETANDNESDACCVWEWACANEAPAANIRARLQQSVALTR